MKKMIITLVAMLAIAINASAMSYEQARNEALFLTDKMAYELNLTDAQYEAAYEINLDYLMSVTGYDDVAGIWWERRNADMRYILYSWQWDAFCAATYFFRPLYWEAGFWHFGIYAHYPRRDFLYFGRPHFYSTYRGGHGWRLNGGHSYYEHHRDVFRPGHSSRDHHVGMRNGWDHGDYRHSSHGNSSTRVTAGDRRDGGRRYNNNGHNHDNRGNNGNFRDNNRNNSGTHGNHTMEGRSQGSRTMEGRSNAGSIGGNRSTESINRNRSIESHSNAGSINRSRSMESHTAPSSIGSSNRGSVSSHTPSSISSSRGSVSSHSSGSFGSSNRGSSSSHSSGSFGSSNRGSSSSHSSGSFGGGSTRGGSSHSSGSFGGGRSSHGGNSGGGRSGSSRR